MDGNYVNTPFTIIMTKLTGDIDSLRGGGEREGGGGKEEERERESVRVSNYMVQ